VTLPKPSARIHFVKRVRLLRQAVIEARGAADWYEVRDRNVADRFRAVLDETIERIAAVPGIGSSWPGEPTVRRVLLVGFPYWLIYEDTADEVIVLAVAHEKRKPGYWRER
jgi:plasmid stabilization system protein ParE